MSLDHPIRDHQALYDNLRRSVQELDYQRRRAAAGKPAASPLVFRRAVADQRLHGCL